MPPCRRRGRFHWQPIIDSIIVVVVITDYCGTRDTYVVVENGAKERQIGGIPADTYTPYYILSCRATVFDSGWWSKSVNAMLSIARRLLV